MIHELFRNETTTGPSGELHADRTRGMTGRGIVHVEIGDGAVVELQARASSRADWLVVETFSETAFKEIPLFPHMRGNITTAGNVSAWLVE